MRKARAIELTETERLGLERIVRAQRTEVRLLERCRVVLLAAEGLSDMEIGKQLAITRQKAARWRGRFAELRQAGLERDRAGRGRKKTVSPEQVAEVIRRTTQERPAGQTHWSTRTLAAAMGLGATTVRSIWRAHGLKPHLAATFKVSNDPHFAEKLEDIVGLYLAAPEHAMVLCCDEKSQVQALDRTQPGLPLKKGRAETFTHDYVRNGTTTLFAALNVADGQVISTCQPKHRHQEWLKFLKLVDEQTPPERTLHVILDNYATHKHPKVKGWIKKHPRFHLHFTPTSASWLNMVERFFREITTKRLRRGVFRSLDDLIAAIDDYIHHYNQRPTPFVWTAKASDILAKVQRARASLASLRH
jgi:transposase